MTLEQIDGLTLDYPGMKKVLLARIGEETDPEDGSLEAELEVYKQILIGAENERLANVARVENFTTRLNAIPDFRWTTDAIGCGIPNLKTLKNQIISTNNLELLEALEAQAGITDQKIADIGTSNGARKELNDSDYKVIRHRDQLDSGIDTTLTSEEYDALLIERQALRDSVV